MFKPLLALTMIGGILRVPVNTGDKGGNCNEEGNSV